MQYRDEQEKYLNRRPSGFVSSPVQRTPVQPSQGDYNPDDYDATEALLNAPAQDRGVGGFVKDLGVSVAQGAVKVPGTVLAAAETPFTGGAIGKAVENKGLNFGDKANERLDKLHTEKHHELQQGFADAGSDADSFAGEVVDKLGYAVRNPSTIVSTVAQSLPDMVAGAKIGSKLSGKGERFSPQLGAGIGEGAMMMGHQAEEIREEQGGELLTPEQRGYAALTGVAGALFAWGGNALAKRLGIADLDVLLTKGMSPQEVAANIASMPAKSVPKAIIQGAIQEGFLEELPQEVSETILQNLALDRDWNEGLADAVVMAPLAGMAMGGPVAGVGAYSSNRSRNQAEAQAGDTETDTGQPATPTQPEDPAPHDRLAPQQVQDEYRIDRPSERLGLNPDTGPLSAAAATAVDSGLGAIPDMSGTLTGEFLGGQEQAGPAGFIPRGEKTIEVDAHGNPLTVGGQPAQGHRPLDPERTLGYTERHADRAPLYEVDPDGVARPTSGEAAHSRKERIDLSTLEGRQQAQAQQPSAMPEQRSPEQQAQYSWDSMNTFERNAAAANILGARGVLAKNTATKAWNKLSAEQQAKLVTGLESQQGKRWIDPNQKVTDQTGPVLQNRDRTSQDSINQMRSISNNPDYSRLKTSGFLSDGAPVVVDENIQIPVSQVGVTDTASAGSERFNVQYAVVEADQLMTSNSIDGTTNAEYQTGAAGKARAIAGNGRITGLQSAWAKGNANQYKADMAADKMHGIDAAVIQGMKNPILVRLLPQDEVTDNIGDLSNRDEKGKLSPVEQAKTDMGRIDLDSLKFTAEGAIGGEAIHQFRMAQPSAERVSEAEARKRLTSAIFQKAYGNDQLTEIQSGESDDAKSILSALAQAAPSMSRLEGAGEFDIRPLITQAGIAAVNAARRGTKLADYVQQSEMGIDPMVYPILEMMLNEHGNIRSSKYIGEQLTNMAKLAYDEANSPGSDMFGEKPKRTAEQVIQDALTGVQGYGQINDGRGQESLGQRGRPESDAQMAERPEGGRERPADTGQTAPTQPEAEQEQPAAVESNAPETWRSNYIQAAKIAREKGIDPKQHKKLADLVAAIDAFNAEPVAQQESQAPTLDLTQQTEETLAVEAERLEQLQKEESAQKAKQKAAESKARERDADKARADEVLDDFQLGQQSEDAMSGMDDIFSTESKSAKENTSKNTAPQTGLSIKSHDTDIDTFNNWSKNVYESVAGWRLFDRSSERFGADISLFRKIKKANAAGGGYVSAQLIKGFSSVEEARAWAKENKVTISMPTVEIKTNKAEDKTKASADKPTAPKAPTEAIEDFGEKIGGARKDVWDGFKDDLNKVSDEQIASQPLSKIWPEPNYKAMIESGEPPKTVALIRALREEITSKPRVKYKLARWAESVIEARSTANALIDGTLPADQFLSELSKSGRTLEGFVGRVELYELVGHEKSLAKIYFAKHHYSLYRGEENVTLWVVENNNTSGTFGGWPSQIATGKTKEQAIEAFRKFYNDMPENGAKKAKQSFDIWSERGREGYLVGKKIGRHYAEFAGPFKTTKEAREYVINSEAELTDKLARYREIPAERRDTERPRVGEDHRQDQDVTPEQFSEAFGFRGVEFGNWVQQGRRQADLNQAYDALMDMAAVLDIPAKAISLNGGLGLAFGARGKGGKNAAKAHYEPGKVVINLSKRTGAGSLGHEWWHALDNYFAKARKSRTDYMTTERDVNLASRDSNYQYADQRVRKEMIDAFGELVKTINLTALRARSRKLDNKRTKEYWTTGEEMSARAFESYLISKLQDKNGHNDYLANIVDESTWKAAEALGFEMDGSYPYPTAGEVPAIRAGFDRFFNTLEVKEGEDGNVLLFSFAGKTARGADLMALDQAQLRIASGDSAETVRQETGWHRGNDGKWRFEISDDQSKLRVSGKTAGELIDSAALDAITGGRKFPVTSDLIDHAQLFVAYPKLSNIKVEKMPAGGTALARLQRRATGFTIQLRESMPREKVASAILHELQHGIQVYEGFAVGGSKNTVFSDLDVSGAKAYRLLAGEVEARNTQTRQTMTPNLRRNIAPEFTADTPSADVIVTFNGKDITNKAMPNNVNNAPITDASLVRAFDVQFPRLTKAVRTMLARGNKGERGGVVVIDSADPLMIARAFASKTGKPITESVQMFSDAGSINGFYDPKSGLTFLVGPNLNPVTGTAVLLHEMIHGQQRQKIDRAALAMLLNRGKEKNAETRAFLDRVAARMVDAGEGANAQEAGAYIVEQAVMEGKSAGYGTADSKFLSWVDQNIGKRVGDFLRSLIGNVRSWALRNGLPIGPITVDDLVSYAMAGMDQAGRGNVDGGVQYSKNATEDRLEGRRQFEETEKAYGGRAAYDQAKSEGKTKLNYQQWVQVRTPAFIEWFGDWQNGQQTEKQKGSRDPRSNNEPAGRPEQAATAAGAGEAGRRQDHGRGTRIPDILIEQSTGEPKVFYHGTRDSFEAFDLDHPNRKDAGWLGRGAYAASDARMANTYAKLKSGDGSPNVMPLFIRSTGNVYQVDPLEKQKLSQAGQDNIDAVTRRMMDNGFDGAYVEHSDSVEIATFSPNNVKSASGNAGTFSAATDDIRFSRAANPASVGAAPNGMAAWDSPSASKFDDFVYKMQDKHVDTKRVIAAIRDTGKAISDDLDVYLQETLFHGRAAKRTQDFLNKEVTPLIEYMQSAKVDMSDLEEFLHARHAQEANALIAKRDPNMPDGGSGMTNAEAAKYLKSLNGVRRKQFENAAMMVDKIIGGTRETIVNYGLESQETVDGWTAGFKHYIPLQREDKDGQMGIGQGFSVKGKETKGRTGSTRKVVDILANVMMQRERAIVRGEKNRVAVAALGLAKDNPLPDFWQVDKVPTTRVLDKATGLVRNQADPMYKSRDNAIVAKVNGQEHVILMNEDDPRAMRMAEALKNLDAAQLEGLLGATATATRYFAAVNTQYNPIFGVTNFVRDIQEAMLHLESTPLKGNQKQLFKTTFPAVAAVWRAEQASRRGETSKDELGILWEDFQNTGGQTGFRDQFSNSADRGKEIQRALTPDGWAETGLGKFFTANGALKAPLEVVRKKAAWMFDILSDYNTAMENGVRLSAYKIGIDSGMSKGQAAALAKGLTVNFNRKGQVTQQLGALYAFFNASVQGSARLGQSLFDMEPGKPKTMRLSKLGKRIVSGGVLLGASQAVLLAMMGFDDDEPPEFIRERNIIIPNPLSEKGYFSIPMPLGYHVIANLGRIPTEFALGGGKDGAKHLISLLDIMSDVYNPLGSSGLSMQTIAPTVLDPLAALAENKDFSGRAIAKESFNRQTPGHALARDTASLPATWLAEVINYATGGTEFTRGELSPTPDQIDYLVGQLTGGVGREATKLLKSAQAITSGDDLPWHNIPLLGRFYGDANSDGAKQSAFYNNMDKVRKHAEEVKGLRASGRSGEAVEYANKHPQAKLHLAARAAEKQVKGMRDRKRELEQAGAPREEIRALEKRMIQRMEQFVELSASK